MHWGTFRLSDEPLAEPPIYLARARQLAGIGRQAFDAMRIGETRTLDWLGESRTQTGDEPQIMRPAG